jgi:GR25 family glycosyltransferase involved in LPS biosynthesis
MTKVSKAFIISLKDSRRRVHVENEVNTWGLVFPVEIFNAVSKKNINMIEQIIKLENDEEFRIDHSRILATEKRLLTPGEIGCMLSHYSVWKKIADDENIAAALILEDDFQFNLGAKEMMELFDAIPDDADICYYQMGVEYKIRKQVSEHYFYTFPSIMTFGYVISKSFAKRLVATFKLNRQSDDYIAEYIMNVDPATNILCCFRPFISIRAGLESEIGYRRSLL